MQRVAIVGSSCAGKSTLAAKLSRQGKLPHIELDALFWGPDWTETPPEEFRARVDDATRANRWVCDGNYSPIRDLVWQRADTLVWLDYSLTLVGWRAVRRTLGRSVSGRPLYNGNRETFRRSFASRDSILLWVLQSFHQRRRELAEHLVRAEHAHLTVFRHRHPQQTRAWRKLAGESMQSHRMPADNC